MTATTKPPHSKRTLSARPLKSNDAKLRTGGQRKSAHVLSTVEGMHNEHTHETSRLTGANLEPLPSVLGLVQRETYCEKNRALVNESLDTIPEGPCSHVEKKRLERAEYRSLDRRDALAEFAKSIPATTLGDAAAHIALAYATADDLEWNQHEFYELNLRWRQIHRCLSSALRVVAAAAGVPIDSIGSKWIAGSFARDFPDLGDRA